MDPPLSILASLWFYMTPGSGVPSMHDVLIGNWAGSGIWQGSVFGPTSKIINNECGGEVFGNWWQAGWNPENNRIKAFRYYTQYFGVPVLGQGQTDATLSCSGGFTYPANAGENKSYDYVGINGMTGINHNECCCKAYPWAGWIRHIDPNFNDHADPETIKHNNDYSKKWCEEMINKYKGLGNNAGSFQCSGLCTQDE